MRRLVSLALLGGLAAAIARKLKQGRGDAPPSGAGASGAPGEATQSPPVSQGDSGGMPAGARRPAPADAPGPSVNAPGANGSSTGGIAELDIDPNLADERMEGESLEAEAEAAAAAEAAAIGGPAPSGPGYDDPAMRPVYEAGGGEAEGFEQAEEELIRNATHDDGRGKPLQDAFTPELEADESGAVYGEADQLHSTERMIDDEGRSTGTTSDEGR